MALDLALDVSEAGRYYQDYYYLLNYYLPVKGTYSTPGLLLPISIL